MSKSYKLQQVDVLPQNIKLSYNKMSCLSKYELELTHITSHLFLKSKCNQFVKLSFFTAKSYDMKFTTHSKNSWLMDKAAIIQIFQFDDMKLYFYVEIDVLLLTVAVLT